jgi:hypothetical protein
MGSQSPGTEEGPGNCNDRRYCTARFYFGVRDPRVEAELL